MIPLHEFPYKATVQDNSLPEITHRTTIWHKGDIQKWADDYFGLETIGDQWTYSGYQNPSVYYFMNEEDYVIFILKFGDKIVTIS